MGFYDRDYMRRPQRGGFGAFSAYSLTTWIIIANVAVFLLDRILLQAGRGYIINGRYVMGVLEFWGYFSESTAIHGLQAWRFVTFQFLHANVDHLIFNMLALYFFGPLVENWLGRGRFMPFYLLCGIGGAALYLILLVVGFRIGNAAVPLVGASAGIFGVLIAAAMIAPNATVLLMFVFPMPLRTLAMLFIAFAVYQVVLAGTNAGGEAAHLGGAAVGWLLMQKPTLLDRLDPANWRRRRRW